MQTPEIIPSQITNVFQDKQNRLFIKSFLLDSSVNQANWGIKPEYIPKHIDRFVGRPFILTKQRTHPLEFYGAIPENYNDVPGTIQKYLQAQEKYRIGTIKKVELQPHTLNRPSSTTGIESANTIGGSNHEDNIVDSNSNHEGKGWFAYIEITDPAAISAFKAGAIPKYVSPTVFRLNHNEKPDETTDFEPLHLAAVDLPAYGFDKAGIRGSCEGDLVSCSKQLQNASIEECGFCIKGTLEGFQNRFANISDSSFLNSDLNQASLTENKQYSVPATATTATPSVTPTDNTTAAPAPAQQLSTTPIEPNTTGSGQPFTKVESTITAPKEEPKKEPKPETGAEKEKDHSKQSSSQEVTELTKTVQALLQEVNGLKSYKENQEKSARDKQDAARRSKIEAAIPENYANSPDERKKAVDVLMKYDNDEQLDYVLNSFVAPTINANNSNKPKAVPQRSNNNRLTDYGTAKSSNSNQVQQGSIASPQFDITKMRRICEMTDIVGNASYTGGGQ